MISPRQDTSQVIALETLLSRIPRDRPWLRDLDQDEAVMRRVTGRFWMEEACDE